MLELLNAARPDSKYKGQGSNLNIDFNATDSGLVSYWLVQTIKHDEPQPQDRNIGLCTIV